VNLDTLAVVYHPRMVRTPARAAKALDGWQRYATWLPSGTLAVTGTDYEAKLVDDKEEQIGTPSGLSLVDTADWTTTVVDAGASFVARAGDVLVAFGGGWVGAKTTGIGLHGYGADGSARFQLFAGEMIGEVQAAAGLVYVVGCSGRCFRIVDPHTGTLAGTAETPRTTQLVGGR
jgi:hypothetical protein